MTPSGEYLPAKIVRIRYGVCGRTLARWEENPKLGFPQPIRINKNRFWRLEDLVNWERARAAGKPTAAKAEAEAENAPSAP
ncbi:MAG: DNA-binding protein [Methyloceanibacter sp.]